MEANASIAGSGVSQWIGVFTGDNLNRKPMGFETLGFLLFFFFVTHIHLNLWLNGNPWVFTIVFFWGGFSEVNVPIIQFCESIFGELRSINQLFVAARTCFALKRGWVKFPMK